MTHQALNRMTIVLEQVPDASEVPDLMYGIREYLLDGDELENLGNGGVEVFLVMTQAAPWEVWLYGPDSADEIIGEPTEVELATIAAHLTRSIRVVRRDVARPQAEGSSLD